MSLGGGALDLGDGGSSRLDEPLGGGGAGGPRLPPLALQ